MINLIIYAYLVCQVTPFRQRWRDAEPRTQPKPEIRDGNDLIERLELHLDPPKRTSGDHIDVSAAEDVAQTAKEAAKFVFGGGGDGAFKAARGLVDSLERRKAAKLAQEGIRYDSIGAVYRSPLGFPCDPRNHKLLCLLENTTLTK